MPGARPFVVGVGGTTRSGSTTERMLRLVLAEAEAAGADTLAVAGPDLDLPPYDPAVAERTPRAVALVSALRRADGVVIASPGYHGSVSGLVKNAIDYAEDLRDEPRAYLSDRAVGIVVCADGVQALGSTLTALRAITHALRGWPTPFAALVRSSDRPFAPDGTVTDPKVARAARVVAGEVVLFARMRAALAG